MKVALYYLLIIALFCIQGCADNEKIIISKQDVIVAFGDSLTQGVGTLPENSYPSILEKELGVTVINSGISGQESIEGLARIESVLEKYQPAVLILCYGGNDLLRKRDITDLKDNLTKIIEITQLNGTEVLLVGVPKPGLFLSPFPLYEELASQYQLISELDVLSTLLSDNAMKSDAVHLNKIGYRKLALSLKEKIHVE